MAGHPAGLTAVNEDGWLLAEGMNANGIVMAAMLTPVPEPPQCTAPGPAATARLAFAPTKAVEPEPPGA